MTLLEDALELIDNLIPRQDISIITKDKVLVDGFPQTVEVELDSIAHVQPLTPFEVKKLTEAVIGSNEYFKFWIVGNLAEVQNIINNKETVIKWNNKRYSIFSKEDWSLSGWIQVIGTLQGETNV